MVASYIAPLSPTIIERCQFRIIVGADSVPSLPNSSSKQEKSHRRKARTKPGAVEWHLNSLGAA